MAEVIWAPAAVRDVESIAEYVARDSPDRAALLASRLTELAERAGVFPQSGRVIPEIQDPACREMMYGPYRVMYRVAGNRVWITGVVHGARDWRPE
jgi:plasmid stabilization system protein ParE